MGMCCLYKANKLCMYTSHLVVKSSYNVILYVFLSHFPERIIYTKKQELKLSKLKWMFSSPWAPWSIATHATYFIYTDTFCCSNSYRILSKISLVFILYSGHLRTCYMLEIRIIIVDASFFFHHMRLYISLFYPFSFLYGGWESSTHCNLRKHKQMKNTSSPLWQHMHDIMKCTVNNITSIISESHSQNVCRIKLELTDLIDYWLISHHPQQVIDVFVNCLIHSATVQISIVFMYLLVFSVFAACFSVMGCEIGGCVS